MDEIEQVKSKIDIVELIGPYVSLKKAGRNFKALCPFHSEKTPSFVVSPERQIYKCFGCGSGGSVFNFLMEYEKMTFGEALRFLADKAGIKLDSFRPSADYLEKEKLLAINHLALEFYHYILLNHRVGKIGLDYLLGRGIRSSSIKLFKLGYAPDNWEGLINYLVKKKGYSLKEVEKTGLIVWGRNYYDRFRGRIIFPLTDHRNNVLGFSARTLKPDLKGAKYINTPETRLYHKSELFYGLYQTKGAIKKEKQAIIAEGETDVITSYQAGVKNIVAIKGSALTEPQVNLIKRFTDTVVLALDADLAGDSAVKKGIEIADRAGLNIKVVLPKYGKDPDECARHSAKLWRQSVKKTIPVFDFYLQSAVSHYNKNTSEGKKRISEELAPLLGRITNEVVKAHYLKKLADVLGVSEETVIKEIERIEKKDQAGIFQNLPIVSKAGPKTKSRREKIEELYLSLLLQSSEKIFDLISLVEIKYFDKPAPKKIVALLKDYLEKKKNKFEINKFAKKLPSELFETLDRLYLEDIQDILKDENLLLREFSKTKKELEGLYLKEKLSKLANKLRSQEKLKQNKNLGNLREKFSRLSKKLKDLY